MIRKPCSWILQERKNAEMPNCERVNQLNEYLLNRLFRRAWQCCIDHSILESGEFFVLMAAKSRLRGLRDARYKCLI